MSSEGARFSEPPHAIHAPAFLIIFINCFALNSTFAIVSTTSAVPEAAVIARDDVFGRIRPATAHIETTIGVVRFPAIPPILCLSATILFLANFNLFPVFTIAFVRYTTSFIDIPLSFSAATKYAISASVKLFLTISNISVFNSSLDSSFPESFFFIKWLDGESSDTLISTCAPLLAFKIYSISFEIPIWLFLTSWEKISTTACIFLFPYIISIRSST